MIAESVGSTGDGGDGAAEDYILIRDEKTSGSIGGTFTAGAWQTRDLNTIVADIGSHVSLASNQITLAAGTYKVKVHAPAFKVVRHKTKLRNITDGSDIVIGSSSYNSNTDLVSGDSTLEGRFTIDDSKVIELQHRCSTTGSSTGFGVASNFGVIEVYAVIEFWKEA